MLLKLEQGRYAGRRRGSTGGSSGKQDTILGCRIEGSWLVGLNWTDCHNSEGHPRERIRPGMKGRIEGQ